MKIWMNWKFINCLWEYQMLQSLLKSHLANFILKVTRNTYHMAQPFLGIYPREREKKKSPSPYKDLYMNIHSLQLETILMSINRWIDKLGYVHIMECCSAVKKNELHMIHTQTCPNLKIAKLSESKQRIHLSRVPFIQTI